MTSAVANNEGATSPDGGHRGGPSPRPGSGRLLTVQVAMLDDSVSTFHVQYKATGRVLFDQVCRVINLLEVDYFGLEYSDSSGTKYWLDYEKPLCRQMGLSMVSPVMNFAVKFYTPDPAQLEEEFTRYLFSLQIKKDLAQGVLQCSDSTVALLASYIVQASCGDYVPEDYPDHTYLSSYKSVPHQDAELEIKIMENHKKHVGQSPAEADLNLLETARRCELYGIRMTPAKDNENLLLNLSVAHMGIIVFQNYTKINTFSWAKIRKLSFKRKKFLIKLHPEGYGYYKDTVEFFFESRNECKNFWKKCIENHAFFRCTEVKRVPRQKTRLFSRGSSFRYSGRTQKQIVEYVRENYVKRQPFQRSTSLRLPSRSNVETRAVPSLLPVSSSRSCGSVAVSFEGAAAEASPPQTAVSEPSSPRRDSSRQGPLTPSQDTDDNVSHDSYRLEEGDSSAAPHTEPGSPSKDFAPPVTSSPVRSGALSAPLVNGQGEGGRTERRRLAEHRASRSLDDGDGEIGANGEIRYVLHKRHLVRGSRTRRSEGAAGGRRRKRVREGSPRLAATAIQASPPTLYARARPLRGGQTGYPVDFVHLAQLPGADSFSSHDDSLEDDSLEKEILEHIRMRKMIKEKAQQRTKPGEEVLEQDVRHREVWERRDTTKIGKEEKEEMQVCLSPVRARKDAGTTTSSPVSDTQALPGDESTTVLSPSKAEKETQTRFPEVPVTPQESKEEHPIREYGGNLHFSAVRTETIDEAVPVGHGFPLPLDLSQVEASRLVSDSIVMRLSPTSQLPPAVNDQIFGVMVGIPPPPEYRSNTVNEVLRRYEELERDLAMELARLGCPPPPPSISSALSIDIEATVAKTIPMRAEELERRESDVSTIVGSNTEEPSVAHLAKAEDISDSSSGSDRPVSCDESSSRSSREGEEIGSERSEEDLTLEEGERSSEPKGMFDTLPEGEQRVPRSPSSSVAEDNETSEGDVETLAEEETTDRTTTFSEDEETALVGDEPTLCSSPFSSSIPETPEGSSHHPSFVDLDIIVGSGLLEQSSSSSMSSYSKNGNVLDTNPLLRQ